MFAFQLCLLHCFVQKIYIIVVCELSVITKRRTGLSSRQLKDAIEKCDMERLPGEYAALILKYMPTGEEVHCCQ